MSEHNLDKMFREKLEGHAAAYSPTSWVAAESLIEGKSSRGGFWFLGILGLLLLGGAMCGAFYFMDSTHNSASILTQNEVLHATRTQLNTETSMTSPISSSTMAMLKPSANEETEVLNVTTDPKYNQNTHDVGAQSSSFNNSPPAIQTQTASNNQVQDRADKSALTTANNSTNTGAQDAVDAQLESSSPKTTIAAHISNEVGTSSKNASSGNDEKPGNISGSTSAPSNSAAETGTDREEKGSDNIDVPDNQGKEPLKSAEPSRLLALFSLPPALAIYDLQPFGFNAQLLPVDLYRPSFWEIKIHAGYGYNVRSLKSTKEGTEGYTALRNKEESIGWSPEIGFEVIYEPKRMNYSIGLNWYSISETNNYSPLVSYEGTTIETSIFTSIETTHFNADSVWVQEQDTTGTFGYWEYVISETLNEDSLILFAYDSTVTTIEKPVDPINERTTFQYVEIPVSIGYTFQKGPWSLGIRTGISAGILIASTGQYLDTDRQSAIVKQDISRRIIWNYQARLALGYALNDKTRIYIEPVFKTNINSVVSRTDFTQKYSTYGLRLGLGFKF
jgi:hypothetical protein